MNSITKIFEKINGASCDLACKLDPRWWWHIVADPNAGKSRGAARGEMIQEQLFGGRIEVRAHNEPGKIYYTRSTTYSVTIIGESRGGPEDAPPSIDTVEDLSLIAATEVALTHLMALRIREAMQNN